MWGALASQHHSEVERLQSLLQQKQQERIEREQWIKEERIRTEKARKKCKERTISRTVSWYCGPCVRNQKERRRQKDENMPSPIPHTRVRGLQVSSE